MKLAEKILKKVTPANIEEKVQNQFFDDAAALITAIKKVKPVDKDFKAVQAQIVKVLDQIDLVDSDGAMAEADQLKKLIKAKKIEETKE